MPLSPPKEHIDIALDIEHNVSEKQMRLYLECMNDKPMSQRITAQELHDGCILSQIYLMCSGGSK